MDARLQVQVVNVRAQSGTSTRGKAYAFQVVDVVVSLPDGSSRVAEVMIDAKDKIEAGKRYELEFAPSISQEKKLTWRISGVKAQSAGAAPIKAAG